MSCHSGILPFGHLCSDSQHWGSPDKQPILSSVPGTQIHPLPGPGLRHPVCTPHMLYPSHLSLFSHAHKVLEINPAITSPRDFLGVPPAHSSTIPGSLCHRAGCLHKDQSSAKRLVPPGVQGLRKTRAQRVHATLWSPSEQCLLHLYSQGWVRGSTPSLYTRKRHPEP